MALRHYQGGDRELAEPPKSVDGVVEGTPRQFITAQQQQYDIHFLQWWQAHLEVQAVGLMDACHLAFLAGRASVQAAPEKPVVSSFRPASLEHVRLFSVYGDDATMAPPIDVGEKGSRTLVAALAYFADMVLQSGAGGEELLSYGEAQDLLKQLTKGDA